MGCAGTKITNPKDLPREVVNPNLPNNKIITDNPTTII